jgi:hypothetical protein
MRKPLRIPAVSPVLSFFLGCPQNVFANSATFDLSSSGVGITGKATPYGYPRTGNAYLVASKSGKQNGAAMTLLAPGSYAANDNEISSSTPFMGAVAFVLSSQATDSNVYFNPFGAPRYVECNSAAAPCSLGAGVPEKGFLIAITEPGTLMLLGSGLLGLAGVARRKLLG